jgi:hypothetical protein
MCRVVGIKKEMGGIKKYTAQQWENSWTGTNEYSNALFRMSSAVRHSVEINTIPAPALTGGPG